MPKITIQTTSSILNTLIDFKIEENAGPKRNYLGLSQIGIVYECPRKAYFAMTGSPSKSFEGRMLRLFRSGDDIELNIIEDLRLAGFDVTDQQKEIEATQGDMTFTGHIDGIVHGLETVNISKAPHLLECKSSKDKKFKELLRLGSYEKWNETYKAQAHAYAYLLGLSRVLVCVENKDNSERYFERFKVDKGYALTTLQLAFAIWENGLPIREVCNNPTFYKARWCDYSGECFKDDNA
jgi:hypothetical protein